MKKENTPTLETERLILRKFTHEDIADLLAIYSDEEVNTFLPWFPIKTTEEMEEYLDKNILPDYTKDIAYRYAIALKSDNRPIGYVTISDIGGSNDLGYGLCKEFWHRGIVSEACMTLVNHLRDVDFPYITATHDVKNPHSGGVMKKIGMTFRYSYDELCQPKNQKVTFMMYQLNLDGVNRTYRDYQLKHGRKDSPMLISVTLGMSVGLMFGVMVKNIPLGMLIGTAIGAAYGTWFTDDDNKKRAAYKKLHGEED